MSSSSSMPFWCARCANRSMTSSTTWRMSRSCASRRSLPASIFEKSRMSLMMASSASAELWMVAAKRRWRGSSFESSSSSVMPSTPFIGVRISCDMRARNSLLARLAASAMRQASTLSFIAWRSVRLASARLLVRSTTCAFEQFLLARQLLLAVLDLAEHDVEAAHQRADLVVRGDLRAPRIVAAFRGLHGLHQVRAAARRSGAARGAPVDRRGERDHRAAEQDGELHQHRFLQLREIGAHVQVADDACPGR